MTPLHPRNVVYIVRAILGIASFPLDPGVDLDPSVNKMLDKQTCRTILKDKATMEGLLTFALNHLSLQAST